MASLCFTFFFGGGGVTVGGGRCPPGPVTGHVKSVYHIAHNLSQHT
jgi:hypothetical protein